MKKKPTNWELSIGVIGNARSRKTKYNPKSKEVADKIQEFLDNKGEIEQLESIGTKEVCSLYISTQQSNGGY